MSRGDRTSTCGIAALSIGRSCSDPGSLLQLFDGGVLDMLSNEADALPGRCPSLPSLGSQQQLHLQGS